MYDQNCRLIVSCRAHVLRTRLMPALVSRIPVGSSYLPPRNKLTCASTVEASVLNSCRRARRATYLHGNRRGCLRGTRETVLHEIESWTKDFEKSPVFWLNGLAGTGKSTITQTTPERLFADGLLGASFFCSRDFEDRSDLHSIFPTIAFQLAHKYPDFRAHFVSLLRPTRMSSTSHYTTRWKG